MQVLTQKFSCWSWGNWISWKPIPWKHKCYNLFFVFWQEFTWFERKRLSSYSNIYKGLRLTLWIRGRYFQNLELPYLSGPIYPHCFTIDLRYKDTYFKQYIKFDWLLVKQKWIYQLCSVSPIIVNREILKNRDFTVKTVRKRI